MLMSNLEMIPWKRIEAHYGLVNGSTVRSKHVGRDFMAGLKNVFGGELKWYTELLRESRQESIERMKQEAEALWANAILNIRFATSSVAAGASEVYAYGTAVKLQEAAA